MATWKWSDQVQYGTGGSLLITGNGAPEGTITAPVGSVFLRGDGGVSSSVYIKEAGSGNTGWTALGAAGGGSTSLATLSDVNTTSPTNGEVLTYDTGTSKWINSAASVTLPSIPIGSVQGNNGGVFGGMGGSIIDFTNGTLTISPPDGGSAAQAALSVVGDDSGSNPVASWYINGGDPTAGPGDVYIDYTGGLVVNGTVQITEMLIFGSPTPTALTRVSPGVLGVSATPVAGGFDGSLKITGLSVVGSFTDGNGSPGSDRYVLSSTNGLSVAWVPPTPQSSSIQFAVPDWPNVSGTAGTSLWRESPYGGTYDWGITGLSGGSHGGICSIIQPTSTVAGYVKFTGSSVGPNKDVIFINGTFLGTSLGFTKTFKTNIAVFGTTSMRFWIGLSNKTSGNVSTVFESDNPVANFVGFRYSDGTDSHWMAYCSTDGTHFSTHDTGVTPDVTGALHSYSFSPVQGTPGTINFYIDGVSVGQLTTNAPTSTTFLGPISYAESMAGGVTPVLGVNVFYAESFQ